MSLAISHRVLPLRRSARFRLKLLKFYDGPPSFRISSSYSTFFFLSFFLLFSALITLSICGNTFRNASIGKGTQKERYSECPNVQTFSGGDYKSCAGTSEVSHSRLKSREKKAKQELKQFLPRRDWKLRESNECPLRAPHVEK